MEQKNKEFEKTKEMLGNRSAFLLFGGRPELVGDRWHVPEHSREKTIMLVPAEDVEKEIEEMQCRGWTVWIGLNEFDAPSMRVENVSVIHAVWFDVDAPRTDKSRPADNEERLIALEEARKLQRFLQREHGAMCFTASSGNGFHLYCPVHPLDLENIDARREYNEKQKRWMQQIREESGVEFDTTYNINRLVQPIGFPNKKIPGQLLRTCWLDGFLQRTVKDARDANAAMLKEITDTVVEEPVAPNPQERRADLNELLKDSWFSDLWYGNWARYGYPSRSEAELAVVRELVHWGFVDKEIRALMRTCGIGKWQAAGESYKRSTLQRAREWEARKRW